VLSRWAADSPAPLDVVDDQQHEGMGLADRLQAEEPEPEIVSPWRGELANRIAAYRVRRRKVSPDAAQSQLPFAGPATCSQEAPSSRVSTPVQNRAPSHTAISAQMAASSLHGNSAHATVSLQDPTSKAFAEESATADEDFSFTIAIGRIASEPSRNDGRMMIDVSISREDLAGGAQERRTSDHGGLYPVASLGDRRLAGIIDAAFLLFACGGFLALFGSLGGQLTLSKLNAAVCLTALSVVYLQYFALFTIFGGTTPGMMFRGLQVVSFTGEAPTAHQMLLRSAGYLLSGGTCLLGFIWAIWDEDELTWHDRFSKTFLSSAQTYAEIETHSAAHPH
jgi:uncharacterized RDD family membrane protein YckC